MISIPTVKHLSEEPNGLAGWRVLLHTTASPSHYLQVVSFQHFYGLGNSTNDHSLQSATRD